MRRRSGLILLLSLSVLLGAIPAAGRAQRWTASDSAWKRGAVCYEIFVRSFFDSDGDGVGDLRGLIEKLDHVNDGKPDTRRDLGARCIWLMPLAESPSYHGYDVADYYRVEPEYGTNADFRRLVSEAHKRGIRVLVDMVLNHASSQHPSFQAALRDTTSPYRSWYRFLPTHPGERNPWGGDNWHKSPVRDEYYYGLFWSGMPDLNYHAPAVRDEAMRIARFWLEDMGADGFRLDAVAFLIEENGIVVHAPGTHDFLREYAAHIRSFAPGAFTIGEVWDSTAAVLPYYDGQLDAYFAFELSDAILETVRSQSAKRLFPAWLRMQRAIPVQRWGTFLRNHDQTRTLTQLGNDVDRARLAATLLLTLPGIPFVYYGEEIGMTGDKPDERLRTPMHWRRLRAAGFTSGTPWQPLQPDSLTANVEAQDADPGSLLNVYRSLIRLRDAHSPLAVGELVPLTASSDSVVAYLRRDGDRVVLVLINLSAAPLANVALASDEGSVGPGRYSLRSLMRGPAAATLHVEADGAIRGYLPLRSVGGMTSYLFELVPAR